MKFFLLSFFCCLVYIAICKCEKNIKNNNIRNLLDSLTERIETDDGKNEYARLTQAPLVKMKLSKAKYNTSLQNILVQSYSEKVKEVIAKTNHEINKEKALLEELNNSLRKVNNMAHVLLEYENSGIISNKQRNKYSHYLDDTTNEELYYIPVYKTIKSNPIHFKNNLISSLTPSELLEKGEISNEQFIKNSQKKLVYPERGDIMIEL